MVMIPIVIVPRFDKASRIVMEKYGFLEKTGLIKYDENTGEILVRLHGNVYVDKDMNFYTCDNKTCEYDEQFTEIYDKMVEFSRKMREVHVQEIGTMGKIKVGRWI